MSHLYLHAGASVARSGARWLSSAEGVYRNQRHSVVPRNDMIGRTMNEKISLVPSRSSVEIQLPDGRVLSGPRGAKVGEFLETLQYDSQLIAAIVNSDLRELTYPIDIE